MAFTDVPLRRERRPSNVRVFVRLRVGTVSERACAEVVLNGVVWLRGRVAPTKTMGRTTEGLLRLNKPAIVGLRESLVDRSHNEEVHVKKEIEDTKDETDTQGIEEKTSRDEDRRPRVRTRTGVRAGAIYRSTWD